MFRCHLSELERTVRSLIALPILAWGYYFRHESEHWSQIIFWTGMYLALTAAITWCPFRGFIARLKNR
jgi:hypothetical protein